MSTPSFSRPGAVDLSALKRTTTAPGTGAPARAPGAPGAPGASGAYAIDLDEQNFQAELEQSMSAPLVLVFYSPSQMPASAQLAADLELLSDEFDGRFLLGKIDIDTAPGLAQALQIPSVPLVALVLQGRLAPLLQDAPPLAELRDILNQVLQAAVTQGVTGRHQPRTVAAAGEEGAEEYVDPRYLPAEDALAAGDIDAAVAEYQKLVDANPADVEAVAGLAMARVLQRTASVDPAAARTAAAERPDDVDAQTLVADLDLLGGHVDDAFDRLIDLVRRVSGTERDAARQHLLGLFAAVGNEDPRVLKGRQRLASALF
jgi:putative thioredoxin